MEHKKRSNYIKTKSLLLSEALSQYQRYVILAAIISMFLCTNCATEEALPVTANFSINVLEEDYSVPVQLQVRTTAEGADTYEWIFEGGVPSQSTQRTPSAITYETPGTYEIVLTTRNRDGEVATQRTAIQIDAEVTVGFTIDTPTDTFSPASYTFSNTTQGATAYIWSFEGGNPSTSTQRTPGSILFTTPGTHEVTLEVTNDRETYSTTQSITVAPNLIADFTYEIAFDDDDLEIPVQVQLQNNSTSATGYLWEFTGATPITSTESNPEVVFTQPGRHTMMLTATNGKETQSTTQTITVVNNTNLRTYTDIHLGINTAHNGNTIGSMFSTTTRDVYTATQITPEIAPLIDVVYFGLDATFDRNRFITPNDLSATTFTALPNAQRTLWVNSIELCNCATSLSVTTFENMTTDASLHNLTITETPGGVQDFDNTLVPRIVLFQTQDGRKGAIKIKEYVIDGQESYIVTDIKVQKERR